MLRFFTAGVCAFLVLCLPAAGFSQASATEDAELKEIAAYRLTMPALQKVLVASRNLAAAAKSDPRVQKERSLRAEIEKLEAKEEPSEADTARIEKLRAEAEALEDSVFGDNDNKTLSEMVAAFKKEPLYAKAMADAGIDPREYAKFLLAYFQAGMIHGMLKSGVVKEVPKEMAAQVNMENVKFIQEHEKELEAIGEELKALDKK